MRAIYSFALGAIAMLAAMIAEPLLRATRLAMRYCVPRAAALPRLVRFAQHAWQKRSYGRVEAGGSGFALHLPSALTAAFVLTLVVVALAHGAAPHGMIALAGSTAVTTNISDQIKDIETTITAKVTALTAINDKVSKEGRTKDEKEREEFDTLTLEVEALTAELKDAKTLETLNIQRAKPVDGNGTEGADKSRAPSNVMVAREEKLEKGIEFARFAMCLAAAKGNVSQALALAENHYPQQKRAINILRASAKMGVAPDKMIAQLAQFRAAAVPAGTTTDATWAAPLVEYNTFAGDFLEYLRPRTIIGRFGTGNIPGLRRIPFNVHIKGQTSGGSANWVGHGKGKPVTKFDFIDAYHGFTKIAAIAVLEEELIRFSNPSAERLVRDALAGAVIERADTDFIDPDVYYIEGVRPASITRAVTAIESSGTDEDAILADIASLWSAAMAANLDMTSAVYITTPAIGLRLGLMRNALGQPTFPDVSMTGGSLLGVPVITSNYAPAGNVVLAFASEIYLSDDDVVTIDASREASIEMVDAPTQDATAGTGAQLVSMFQSNSVALRAERYINWSKRRTTAVEVLKHVAWGGGEIVS